MIELAPIVPHSWGRFLPGLHIRKHFCFARFVVEDDNYRDLYQSLSGVLLDNLVFEEEPPLSPYDLRQACIYIQPEIVFIPDVINDLGKTLKLFDEYYGFLENGPWRIAGAPQGVSEDEVVSCSVEMLDSGVDVLAIPNLTARNIGIRRSQIISNIQMSIDQRKLSIHLLGADWPYIDERLMKDWSEIRSFDTAEITSCSINEKLIRSKSAQWATRRPKDFFDLPEPTKRVFDFFQMNLRTVREWLQ